MSAVVEENVVVENGSTVETPAAKTDVVMGDDAESARKARARRQVEFYFADSNLPYDKFMWQLHSKTPEHWVPISAVASFKRMRQYSSGENGVQWVADVLKSSEYLEVDESGENVRRRTEVQEPKGQFERSVYAKGFGTDESKDLQLRLEELFQGYGSTNEVRMRRSEDKSFKGSVFVEFTEPAGAEALLKAEPKPKWDGEDLLIMSKEAYCEMKIKEKGLTGKNAERKRDTMNKRNFNAFTIPISQGGLMKYKAVEDGKPKREIWLEFMGKKLLIERDEDGNGRVKEEEVPFLKGSTLKFEGVGENFSWNDIKLPLKDLFEGRAPFIDYTRGKNDGFVGFHKELSDEDILNVKKTIRTINGNEITWSQIDEEEEKSFQIRRAQSSARAALRNDDENSSTSRPQRGGRGGSRGGASRGRGGRGGRDGGRESRGGRGEECWITDGYRDEQVFLEYFLELLSAALSCILFTFVLLRVRGNLILVNVPDDHTHSSSAKSLDDDHKVPDPDPANDNDNDNTTKSIKSTCKWRFQHVPSSDSWQLVFSRDLIDTAMLRFAGRMVWFPISYTLLLLPSGIAGLSAARGHPVSPGAEVFVGVTYNLIGLTTVLLLHTTRHLYPSSADLSNIPGFETKRSNHAFVRLMETGGVTPFDLCSVRGGGGGRRGSGVSCGSELSEGGEGDPAQWSDITSSLTRQQSSSSTSTTSTTSSTASWSSQTPLISRPEETYRVRR